MKKKTKLTVLIIGFGIATGIVLYPLIANIYNNYVESQMIANYEETISTIDESEYDLMIEEAQIWNQELYGYVGISYFSSEMNKNEIYESLLNLNGDGMMGYIIIPSIDVNLPIYHYSTDDVLLLGAGHMEDSSLPVGGETTHCVITAHRGLPSATMFTDLDKVEIGDVFYLKILNQTLCYEVISIEEVDPEETSSLVPVEGEDLCTLVTCTPYGVNSQRMLVTGTRVETEEEVSTSDTSAVAKAIKSNFILVIILFVELFAFILMLVSILKMDLNNTQRTVYR